MVQHGPTCLEGPVTRKRRCWRESFAPFRAELVARIRQEIATGIYDTPEKWEAALACLLEHLEDR